MHLTTKYLDAMEGSVHAVIAFVTAQPTLLWVALVAVAAAVGAFLGKTLNGAIRTALGIAAGLAGIALFAYIVIQLT